jgi:hypothetical protein
LFGTQKRQNTVETSTFGGEFVAMRQATELIEALRYKLRMFGIPINGPTKVYGDNHGAGISHSSIRTSALTKKRNVICNHCVREAVAAGATAIRSCTQTLTWLIFSPSSCLLEEDTTSCSVLPTKLKGRRSQHELARSKAPTLAVAGGIFLVRMSVPS